MSYTKVGDNKYRIFVSDGTNFDKSRRRFSKTITTDLKGRDLEKFLTLAEFDFEDEVKKKDPKFYELAKGTFESYSKWWLEYKEVNEGLSSKTIEGYAYLLVRLNENIGHFILEKLTNVDMLEFMKNLKETPAKTPSGKLTVNTIKHYHTLLKVMFNDAVGLKILIESPMINVPVENPKTKLKDNYYTIEDVQKAVDLLPNESIKHTLAFLLAVSTGMRIEEITGLEWKHIDINNLKIKIEQANSYTKAKGIHIVSTKNTHSERGVAFPASLVPLIEKHKVNEIIKKEKYNCKNDYVFTQRDGKLAMVSTPSKWFQKFIKKNNLKKITFHGLRHTHATISIYKGINIVSISKILGHAKPSTATDIYAHHLVEVERQVAEIFDEILQSGSQSGSDDAKLKIVK